MASQKQIDANRSKRKKIDRPQPAGKAKSRLNALRDGLTGQITTLSDKDRPVFEQLKAELVAGFDPQTPMERKLAHAIAWDTWRLDHLRAIEMNIYALGAGQRGTCRMRPGPKISTALRPKAPTAPGPKISTALRPKTPTAPGPKISTALGPKTPMSPTNSTPLSPTPAPSAPKAKRFELMSLYETRMNRGMHRNLAILRDLQAERKRNYERDKKDEVLIARLHEFNDMPIQASTTPSKNGFLFSNEEIAVGAVRQRYVDTAGSILKNTNPTQLYGTLRVGCRDSLLEKVADQRPLSQEERNEIDKVPLEARVIHRLNHPEEYGLVG
jgi:hypothetical protein